MNIKEEIIEILNNKILDKEEAAKKVEALLAQNIISEMNKNSKPELVVISEGSVSNALNSEDIGYALCEDNDNFFNLNETVAFKSLKEKEVAYLVQSKCGVDIKKLINDVRIKVFSELSGNVELINFNTSNDLYWLECVDILTSNSNVESINGIPIDVIKQIKELCDILQYSKNDKNKLLNELFDIQNKNQFANVAVEIDEEGNYLSDYSGRCILSFDMQYDSNIKNYVFPFRDLIKKTPLYEKYKQLGLDENLTAWLSINYATGDSRLNKFLKDIALLLNEVNEFTNEFGDFIEEKEEDNNILFPAVLKKRDKHTGKKCETDEDLKCKYPFLSNSKRIEPKYCTKSDRLSLDIDNLLANSGDACYALESLFKYRSNFILKYDVLSVHDYERYAGKASCLGNVLLVASCTIGVEEAVEYWVEGDYEAAVNTIFSTGLNATLSFVVPKAAGSLIETLGMTVFAGTFGSVICGAIATVMAAVALCDLLVLTGIAVCAGVDWLSHEFEKALETGKFDAILAHWLRDPLILDLTGTGFVTTMNKDGVHFDLNCDGFAERINWTTENGLLALDLNGNGMIDDGGEVFGDSTLLPDGSRAKNGFEALAQYDLNKDGIIDENDEIYERLRVWVDADSSGESEDGELKSLKELGIKAINLNYEGVNENTDTEVVIGNRATYFKEDGSEMAIGEMWVAPTLIDSVEKMTPEIAEKLDGLPDVRSYGTVSSLHSAMAKDETGELKELVEQFTKADTYDEKLKITDSILYFICGVKDIDDSKMWGYAKEKELKVIERMTGEEYIDHEGSRYPNNAAGPILSELYKDIRNMYCISMVGSEASDLLKLLLVLEKDGNSIIFGSDGDDKTLAGWGANIVAA